MGSSHFTEGIAERYVREGHEVVVLTTSYGDHPAEEWHLGYRVVRVPSVSFSPGRIAFNYSLPFAARPSNAYAASSGSSTSSDRTSSTRTAKSSTSRSSPRSSWRVAGSRVSSPFTLRSPTRGVGS